MNSPYRYTEEIEDIADGRRLFRNFDSDKKLTDVDIDLYMNMLNEQYGDKKKFMNSLYMTGMLMNRYAAYNPKKATKYIKEMLLDDGTLPEAVVIPINLHQIHWGDIIVLFRSRHILVADSFDNHITIQKNEQTVFTNELKRCYSVLVEFFNNASMPSCYDGIFKSHSPWIYVRAFFAESQTGDKICGYYALGVARIVGLCSDIASLCMFHLTPFTHYKQKIMRELNREALDEDFQTIVCLSYCEGISKTKCSTLESMRTGVSQATKLYCILNPLYITKRTLSKYAWQNCLNYEKSMQYKTLLEMLKKGSDFTMVITTVTKPNDIPKSTLFKNMYLISLAFESIASEWDNLYKLNLNKFNIVIQSNLVDSMVKDTTRILALEADWLNEKAKSEKMFKHHWKLALHDLLACLFHTLVRLCKTINMVVLPEGNLLEQIPSIINGAGSDIFQFKA